MQIAQQHNPQHLVQILRLIATNDYENIVLAITLAKGIGIDLHQALQPLVDCSQKYYLPSPPPHSSEETLVFFLQAPQLHLTFPKDFQGFHNLSFCQNVNTLILDLQGQHCAYNFEHLHLKSLQLKHCTTWPLVDTALEHLSQQTLQKLIINSNQEFGTAHAFEVPNSLGLLTNLYKLELEHPNLKQIPQSILKLEKLQLLTLHSDQKQLLLPDEIFNRSLLRYAYLDRIPDNTFVYISDQLKFSLRNPQFSTFWKLTVWKKRSKKHWQSSFNTFPLALLQQTVQIAQRICNVFLPNDPKSPLDYRIHSSFLFFWSFLLLPLISISSLLLYIVTPIWRIPESYQQYSPTTYTGKIILQLAHWAAPAPTHIEGLGPMGCLGGTLFLAIVFFQDVFFPFIARLLFMPLALIIGVLGCIVEPIARIFLK